MELVFETVNRSGGGLERHRAVSDSFSIGRAFDNDIILSDETVSPHHATLRINDAGQVVIVDLDSLNGIRCGRANQVETAHLLRSGEVYSFGRAKVRIYNLDHPMEPTVLIGGTDSVTNALGSTVLLSIVLAIAFAFAAIQQWLNTYTAIVWQELATGVFGVVTVGILIAAFWAIVGRIVKHDGEFQTQLCLVMSYLLIQSAIVACYELVQFNTLNKVMSISVFLSISFVLLTLFVWLALHVATHLASEARMRFSLIVATVLVGVSIYPELLRQSDFSTTPQYIQIVRPPFTLLTEGEETNDFLLAADGLFSPSNHNDD